MSRTSRIVAAAVVLGALAAPASAHAGARLKYTVTPEKAAVTAPAADGARLKYTVAPANHVFLKVG